MKKLLQFLICLLFVNTILNPYRFAFAQEFQSYQYRQKTKDIATFSQGLNEMIERYDCDTDSNEDITDNFATARLIVFANRRFDTYGAVEHITNDNMHILQYATPNGAEAAYELLKSDKRISKIQPDRMVYVQNDYYEEQGILTTDGGNASSVEHSWGYDRIQTEEAFNYILRNKTIADLPEITVRIIDDGIGYRSKNDAFKNRVKKQYSFLSDKTNIDGGNHGSFIADIIVENTLPNVKLISYQCIENHKAYTSLEVLALKQAELDGVDILNCSYGHLIDNFDVSSQLHIPDDKPLKIAAAGNESTNKPTSPACLPEYISVASLTNEDKRAYHSNYGEYVDVVAPGSRLKIYSNAENSYRSSSGTSFAAPFAVSVCAMIMTQFPTLSKSNIAQTLFDSCEESNINVKYGIINMFKAVTYYDTSIKQIAPPEFSMESRPSPNAYYNTSQSVSISCTEPDIEIYYTLDNTIPSKTNGILYTKPIQVTDTVTVKAIAYSDSAIKSALAQRTFYIRVPLEDYPNENGWHIRENGMIWGYSGADTALIIPETVLGIQVKGIEKNAFEKQNYIASISMPRSLTVIEKYAFSNCLNLLEVNAPGVTTVGEYAFYGCKNLDKVDFSSLKTIGRSSFSHTGALGGFPFKNISTVPRMAFYASGILKADLKNADVIQHAAFSQCYQLTDISMPAVEELQDDILSYCPMLESISLNPDCDCLSGRFCRHSGLVYLDNLQNIVYSDELSLADNDNLFYVELDNLKETGERMFENDIALSKVVLPNAEVIESKTFSNCSALSSLQLSDELKQLEDEVFSNCDNLTYVQLNGNFANTDKTFYHSAVNRLEMNSVKSLNSLPETTECIIAMPHSFFECSEVTSGRNYKIYGSQGSYAQQWASENGHTFFVLSQENAVIQEVDAEFPSDSTLCFDCIGFNKIYTWYGTDTQEAVNGVKLYSDKVGHFNPQNYEKYHYYYCVCTSTDIDEADGFEQRELICSRICRNTDYIAPNEAITETTANESSTGASETTTEEITSETSENVTDESNAHTTENTTKHIVTTKPSTEENTTLKDESTTTSNETTGVANQTVMEKNLNLISPNTGSNRGTIIAAIVSVFILFAISGVTKKHNRS